MRWKRCGCKWELRRTFWSEDRFVFDRYRSFVVYEACLFQEFLVHIFPAAKITLLYNRVSKCQPPASKPTIHLLEIFLSTIQNSCLEIFNFSSVIVCQFLWHFNFSSVLVFQVLWCMQINHIISVYQCPHKWQSHTFKSWNVGGHNFVQHSVKISRA